MRLYWNFWEAWPDRAGRDGRRAAIRMNNNFTGPYPAEITALALSDTDLAQVAPDENDPDFGLREEYVRISLSPFHDARLSR